MTVLGFFGASARSARFSRVGLFGILGAGNIGNDAQMESVLGYLEREHPYAVVDAMTTGPEELRTIYGINAVPMRVQLSVHSVATRRKGPRRLVMAGLMGLGCVADAYRIAFWVRRHQIVIVPGAGVLESSLPLRPWSTPYSTFLVCLFGKVFRTKVALVCVGANVINQRLSRLLCLSAAKLAFYCSYRDDFSRDAMREQGVDTSAARVYADLAFGIPPAPEEEGDADTVGVGVMAYYGTNDDREQAGVLHEAYVEKLKTLLRRLVDSGRRVRLFVGDSNGSDARISAEVLADLRAYRPDLDQAWIGAEETYSFAELMKSMSAVGSVIATRYHNVLCAVKLGKPTVAVGYSRKHNILMRDMGMAEYCQPIKSLDVDQVIEQLDRMAERSVELRRTMRERHTAKAQLLEVQFAELSAVLFSGTVGRRRTADLTRGRPL